MAPKLPVKITRYILATIMILAASASNADDFRIRIGADTVTGTCHNFWSVKNFTWQHIFDDPLGAEPFRRNHPYVTEVNCIRLIGGRGDGRNRWLLEVRENGDLVTDFSDLIVYLRTLLEWGYTPMIVLDNVPLALSEPYEAYHRYIQLLTESLVENFGLERVSEWRFRVMTEPDLFPGHWAATKEEFLKLYDYAVDAVTAVIPNADIGPGNILNPVRHTGWGLDIIDHCARGTNYRTGRVGTRMTHFSFSWYGRIGEPVSTLAEAFRLIRSRLDKYESLRETPVGVAEFAVLFDAQQNRYYCGEGTEWSASWLASVADIAWEMNIERIHQWATTSAIDTAPDAPNFEEVRALMPEGMAVPYTHVLTMLEAMAGGKRLNIAFEKNGNGADLNSGIGAIACEKEGEVLLMVYNHQPGFEKEEPVDGTIAIALPDGSGSESWTLSEWLIDAGHSGFTRTLQADCEAAGLDPISDTAPMYPANISERFGVEGVKVWMRNLGKYEALSRLHQVRDKESLSNTSVPLEIHLNLPVHSVRFLRLKP